MKPERNELIIFCLSYFFFELSIWLNAWLEFSFINQVISKGLCYLSGTMILKSLYTLRGLATGQDLESSEFLKDFIKLLAIYYVVLIFLNSGSIAISIKSS